MDILVGSLFITLIISLVMFARSNEKKRFNNGVCPECFTKLNLFDYDSGYARGYVCDNCHYTVWVSYSIDKLYKELL